MDKKILAFLLVGVAGGFVLGWFLYPLSLPAGTTPTIPNTILYGTGSRPRDLDPAYAWDSASADVIDQVFEGLFRYDLSTPACTIEPWLATDFGTWDASRTELTLSLRQGVMFQDGWQFNATAVQFTFDRLNFLCNSTGERDANNLTQIAELYTFNSTDILYTDHFNNQTIINHVEILGTYQVKFVLNCSYPAFLPLLCFSGSYIVSPNPNSTPFNDFITLSTTAKIYGTGPYIYDQYVTNTEVRFHRNDNWWVNPVVKPVQYLRFVINTDAASRNNAMLSGDTNFIQDPLPGMLATFGASSVVNLINTGHYNWAEQYLGMNNVLINGTWRTAISYALNYTYIDDVIMLGNAQRLKSPIPMGIPMANYSFNVATCNLTVARQTMVDMGFGSMGWTDQQWRDAATNTPFRTLNYTYNSDNDVRTQIGSLLVNNMAAIGIKVTLNPVTWPVFLNYLYDYGGHDRMELELFFVGWIPDYVDPSNFINPIFNPASMSNSVLCDDPYLNANMTMAIFETDPIVRQDLYNTIQKYIVEELHPYCYCYQALNFDVAAANLHGFPSNPMGKVYFAPCFFTAA